MKALFLLLALTMGNWDPFNYQRLKWLIESFRFSGHYAVFDWDNTSVFLDTEEAAFNYALEHELLVLDEAVLRAGVPSDFFAPEFNNAAGQRVNVDMVVADVLANRSRVNVRAKMRYLYEALDGTFGAPVSYPWLAFQFSGLTPSEVREITRKTLEWQLSEPVSQVRWTSEDGPAGVVSVHWKNGLRLVAEVENLYRSLQAAGIDVWVCTASLGELIRPAAARYGVPPERVIGMELALEDGRFVPRFQPGYQATFGPGKSWAIRQFLAPRYGRGPVLVAGDSQGDKDMLRDFPDMKIGLIFNLLKPQSTEIGGLARVAVESRRQAEPRYLLQGRDENTGELRRSYRTVRFGSKEHQALGE